MRTGVADGNLSGEEGIEARRRLSPGRYHVNYEYEINGNNYDNDNEFGGLEKGGTTSASYYANNDAAVSMIPYISNIISAGDDDDDDGGNVG